MRPAPAERESRSPAGHSCLRDGETQPASSPSRRDQRPHGRARAFPLPPRFALALPAFIAYVLVVIVAAVSRLAGAEPGVLMGVMVSSGLISPFAAFGWLYYRRRREYRRALASGELDGWREAALRVARSRRPGFWGTLVVASLGSVLVVAPAAIAVAVSFGVGGREVTDGLFALAVVLPIPVAAGAWLIPTARNEAERRRELNDASSSDAGPDCRQ